MKKLFLDVNFSFVNLMFFVCLSFKKEIISFFDKIQKKI